MLIVGLTGCIGSGKSTVARMFAACGVRVHDADAAVHALYAEEGSLLALIAEAFPGVLEDGAVNRARLGELVFEDKKALLILESIIHPFLSRRKNLFLREAECSGEACVLLDAPLLFEAGWDVSCDYVIVTTAAQALLRARALSRPNMTEARRRVISERQLCDVEKRRRADFLIETGGSLHETERRVRTVLRKILSFSPGKGSFSPNGQRQRLC